jgi:hypothetical protein
VFSWKLIEFMAGFCKVASEKLWVSVVWSFALFQAPGGGVVRLILLVNFGSVVL